MFGKAAEAAEPENIIFWIAWIIVVFILNIIFLNFIIAEAGASYSRVKDSLDEFIALQKASLIAEAEDMFPDFYKSPEKFPKYIITRSKDE